MNSFNPTSAVDAALTQALAAACSAEAIEITPAHILSALMSRPGGASTLLRVLGVDSEALCHSAAAIAARNAQGVDPGVVPHLNEAALAACREARRLADERGSDAVHPEHLLIGLAHADTAESRLLAEHGASYYLLRAALAGRGIAEPRAGDMTSPRSPAGRDPIATTSPRESDPDAPYGPQPEPAPQPNTSGQFRAPVPVQVNEFRLLLTMVAGSRSTAERLIAFEQRQSPGADRATWISQAIARLRHDGGT
ncbi:Clp protease N-terminal domain-containing protein [Nocardia sp. NPDC050717]|uniref:Clp protease N-terminal domain-containing protein n=1 Tax=Nocardia sp. NPDC050717 TaxID=3157221 RepID=UPI0033F75ABB